MESQKNIILEEIRGWFERPEAEIEQMLEERRNFEKLYQENLRILQEHAERWRRAARNDTVTKRRLPPAKRCRDFTDLSVQVSPITRTELNTFTHVMSGLPPHARKLPATRREARKKKRFQNLRIGFKC